MKSALRVVLDTHVVLSSLLFREGPAARLRAEWQAGRIIPFASTTTAQELVRVLGYPKFRLTPLEQEELLADYIPWVKAVVVPHPPPRVPACRDAFDLPFLHLAVSGKASALVTGDKDLLAVAQSPGLCPVMTVEAFCATALPTRPTG